MKINEEINRIKNLMGLVTINESIDPTPIIKKLFGVSDETAQKLVSNTESVLKKFVGGRGTYDDIAEYVSKESGILKNNVDVVSWIKSQPEIMDELIKSSDTLMKQSQQEVFSKLKLSNILDEKSILLVDDILTLKLNKNNAKSLPAEINFVVKELKKIITTKGQNKNIDELIKNLEDKKKIAEGYKSIEIKPIKSNSPKVDLGGLVEKWKTPHNCYDAYNCIDAQKIISELYGKLNGLPETFNPSNVKLGEWGEVKWIDSEGIQRERVVIEVSLPNNQKVLMYKSSGTNISSTGKKAGEWFILPGFGQSGFFIKTQQSIDLTKGENKYLTEFATYLENNGFDNLGKKVEESDNFVRYNLFSGNRISNRSFINQEQNINWNSISNAKNMDDYNKLIAQAIETGDYQYISKGGFEKFGIDNFRKFLMDNIERVYDLDISTGRWSVQFK